MADNFDDELALLYDDILTRLNKGETLADIDLDSLIEVYDYAYDLSDEFVTAEIMNNVLSERNIQIVISLLKQNGIRKIVASPGATKVTFVGSLQGDSF